MNERIEHLKLIQAIITRLSNYGYGLKGWGATLSAAVLALAAGQQAPAIAVLAGIPVVVLWGLDAWFLCEERRFRALYDWVRQQPADTDLQFNLSPAQVEPPFAETPLPIAFREVLLIFWGGLLVLDLLVALALAFF